jgi:GNAT superfamily N-acetyltransferase
MARGAGRGQAHLGGGARRGADRLRQCRALHRAPQLEIQLFALYVRAAWWGTGIGHALFVSAVGDRSACLWVLEGNDRVIRFYERQGFRFDGAGEDEPYGRRVRMVREKV